MTLSIAGLPASRKTPGVNFNVILGGSGASSGTAPEKTVLLGNMIATAITGASPSFSCAAGTATVAEVAFIASPDDAATLFGRGSEMSRMAAAFFAQYPDGTLYGCPVADAAGTAATAVLTFATTASAGFTVRLKLCGTIIDVAVLNADTATVIAAAVADAINDAQDLPYTAQNSSGAVTITAKNTGPRGNTLIVDAYFVTSAGTEIRITTSTSSGSGTAGTWSGTSSLGSEITLTGGATQDSFANALTAIEPVRYHRIVGSCIDATNIGRIQTHIETQAGPTVQKLEQGVVGCSDTLSNCTTLATGRNAARMQVVWHFATTLPVWECAAQECAARLIGDAYAGGSLVGESSDPAANLIGCELKSVPVQRVVADQPTATEIESALNNGITPLAPSASRPGYATIVRPITSRSLRSGTPNYAVLDTSCVTVPDYVADYFRSDLATTFAGCKLAPDAANNAPPTAPRVVTPSIARARIVRGLVQMERNAILVNVAANLDLLVVEIDGVTPGRLNVEIPAAVIPPLAQVFGNVRQLSPV